MVLRNLIKLNKREKLQVICKHMQKLHGGTDCGFFAAFVASCVLSGLDPCVQTVDRYVTRASLSAMFIGNEVEVFL
jgi:hypothetical protein